MRRKTSRSEFGSHESTKMAHPVDIEALATQVIDCGFHLHKDLGPRLLESAYEQLMAAELGRRGIAVSRQVAMPLSYNGVVIDNAFKLDLLVERTLIVELKSIEMNFGQATFKDGLRRVANDYWRPSR